MLVVNEREEGVVGLLLPIGSLNTRSRLESIPRCEPNTYELFVRRLNHCAIGAGALICTDSILFTGT